MRNKERLLRFFFDNPTGKFHIRELARISKLNPNTILNIVNDLVSDGILVREKKKHLVEISVHLSDKFRMLKRIDNLKRLYGCGIIEFLEEEFHPKCISVVGSYSTGEDIENSDADIVVICNGNEEKDLSKYEKKLSRKIHLIITDYKSMSDEFYVNLINGIVLFGYLDKK